MVLVLLPILLLVHEKSSWAATPSIETLTPNEYEEKEFKDNTDFLNEKALYKEKVPIPEVQKKLTFEKPTSGPMEKVTEKLFAGTVDNTVASQAKKMRLFTGEKKGTILLADSKPPSNPKIKVTVVLAGLLAIGLIIMIVLLIPKMVQGNRELK